MVEKEPALTQLSELTETLDYCIRHQENKILEWD
jgi:hypothetical protein